MLGVSTARPVSAQPADARPPTPRYAFGVAGLFGGTPGGATSWGYLAIGGEGAIGVLQRGPWELRGRGFLAVGETLESDWSGSMSRLGAGAEGRVCSPRRIFCGFADLDVGYQSMTLHDDRGDLAREDRGLLYGTRLGLELGSQVRFRAALELHRLRRSDQPASGERSFRLNALAVAIAFEL